ncbi:MAG: aminopeptidase P family protein [Prevotellaceae bacterium]|nr:aminopeptidase P family protein [Prevotellaceae bacterium]
MNKHLRLLREFLLQQGFAAIVVPSNDPHFSEYVSPRFKCREWLTAFSGSAGTAVVALNTAGLFTDSRYFLQAVQQLENSGFELMKEGLPDSVSIAEYLKQYVPSGTVVVDGSLYSVAAFNALKKELEPLTLVAVADPFEDVWPLRPSMPDSRVFEMPSEFAGATIAQKLQALTDKLKPAADSIYLASDLSEVAWFLNLRGGDVAYTPVNVAHLIVDFDAKKIHLFITLKKIDDELSAQLERQGVALHPYEDYEAQLAKIAAKKTAILTTSKTSVSTYNVVSKAAAAVVEESTINGFGALSQLKAKKNSCEVDGIRKAMLADGVAWLRFWKWLEENVDSGSATEFSVGKTISDFRALHPDFLDDSFAPIVGYKGHGAIVHYSATEESSIALGRDTFILIDTGGQYRYGTTDITRTLHLGHPTAQEKTDYTLVLKGHLQLSAAKFPYGTRGAQLDMLARQPLMQHGLNYLHGTGHGVGHCLCVHEGPQSIRLNENPTLLEEGMLTSCEPGIYRANQYGIRIENLVLTTLCEENEFGRFLQFEPVTLCPFDVNAIDKSLLDPRDLDYFNAYHDKVYALLAPLLDEDEKAFLKKKTEHI